MMPGTEVYPEYLLSDNHSHPVCCYYRIQTADFGNFFL